MLARIGLDGGVIEAAALEAVAVAAVEAEAGHLQLTRRRHLEVHGIAEHRVDRFADRLVAAGLPVSQPASRGVSAAEPPRVGWFEGADGLVTIGAVTEYARMTPEQARYAAAVGVPVIFTGRCEIVIGGLTEAVAETVVRVLAPLGFIFDATSVWASPVEG